MEFNLKALVTDLGGAAAVSKLLGKSRTSTYRYLKQGFMTTKELERIKEERPELNLNTYFERSGA